MLYFNYDPAVVWLLLLALTMSWAAQKYVIVALPGQSHLLIEMAFPFIDSTNKLQLKLVLLT